MAKVEMAGNCQEGRRATHVLKLRPNCRNTEAETDYTYRAAPVVPSGTTLRLPSAHLRSTSSPHAMEKIKEKLTALRGEADHAHARADELETKNKALEQALLEKENEIKSKDHRLDELESKYEETEAKLRDVTEKYATDSLPCGARSAHDLCRLRRQDVDTEHIERQAKRFEQERDDWEKKFEEANAKYRKAQGELDELVANMDSL
ncbi:hypothetical protein BC834DRAFT_857610 [Gloeopeniophorella convolvens]|nr:hypothetical protein BC834DRAFT_857610 [Gloeopeniophorella convolvens]